MRPDRQHFGRRQSRSPDRYDQLPEPNTIDAATPMPSDFPTSHHWIEVTPHLNHEARAFELNIDDLNLHLPDDWHFDLNLSSEFFRVATD